MQKKIIKIPPPPPPIIKRFEIMEWIVDSINEGVIHHQYHKRMHRFKSGPKKVALALCAELWSVRRYIAAVWLFDRARVWNNGQYFGDIFNVPCNYPDSLIVWQKLSCTSIHVCMWIKAERVQWYIFTFDTEECRVVNVTPSELLCYLTLKLGGDALQVFKMATYAYACAMHSLFVWTVMTYIVWRLSCSAVWGAISFCIRKMLHLIS